MNGGILSPAFLQAACAKNENESVILFKNYNGDMIALVIADGEITIESTKNGEKIYNIAKGKGHPDYEHMTDMSELTPYIVPIAIQSDNNESIKLTSSSITAFAVNYTEELRGVDLTSLDVKKCKDLVILSCNSCTSITELNLSANTALQALDCSGTSITELNLSANTALQTLDCNNCTSITELNLSANTALQTLSCNSCTSITELNLSANTALQTLYCNSCTSITELNLSADTALQTLYCAGTSITELNLSANTALQTLDCDSCTSLSNISYPATNSDVSTAIAGAITAATAADGTVYTDTSADYFSTIADAATAKGWTIEQLS